MQTGEGGQGRGVVSAGWSILGVIRGIRHLAFGVAVQTPPFLGDLTCLQDTVLSWENYSAGGDFMCKNTGCLS